MTCSSQSKPLSKSQNGEVASVRTVLTATVLFTESVPSMGLHADRTMPATLTAMALFQACLDTGVFNGMPIFRI